MSLLALAFLTAAGHDGLPRTLELDSLGNRALPEDAVVDPASPRLRASMTHPGQEPEERREAVPPPEGTFTEFLLRHHLLEGGFMFTVFEKDLDIESDVAWWVRTGVALTPNLSLHVTYRQYDFTNSALPGGAEEDVDLRGVFGGVSFRVPLTFDFALVGGGSLGMMRWDSHGANLDDDTGPALTTEAALVWAVTPVFRVRAGAGFELARTEFHDDDDETRTLISYTLGLEIGGW